MAQTASNNNIPVPIDRFIEKESLSRVIAYPNPTIESVTTRIRQLQEVGVTSLIPNGTVLIEKFSVLGKGVVGIVVTGMMETSELVAVKLRRTDSRRPNMLKEASMLQAANKAGIGPRHLGSKPDVLIMELITGERLPVWLSRIKGRGQRVRLRKVIKQLFDQTVKLDAYALDHGELSRAHKNIMITEEDKAWILDFESASQMRRVNNFTSLAQYLFLGNSFGKKMQKMLGLVDRKLLIDYLRMYKTGNTANAYSLIKQYLKLND